MFIWSTYGINFNIYIYIPIHSSKDIRWISFNHKKGNNTKHHVMLLIKYRMYSASNSPDSFMFTLCKTLACVSSYLDI